MALLTIPIAVYSLRYSALGSRAYQPNLAASFLRHSWVLWVHVTAGPIALVLGPFQFVSTIRTRALAWHRRLGTAYVGAAFLLGLAGLDLAWYSNGGWVTHLGFGALALGVLGTTTAAYRAALRRNILAHRRWMIRSYALIYAAVTLRILLPLLIRLFAGDFLPAYRAVSWLCWVPNVVVAEILIRRRHPPPVIF